ncbi:hypothetical protein GWK16_09325 [Roseomonas sp. JC162]|uniref:Uncharacterized protein n=1 Tax=Neoroseomonas marina TaxID=1232220 RepID=A0A848ED42_9PROT|nr:hypothetical protein [Neoroseomonas marina]NMJ41439.1 hypothetical protein [Neoroseomonas marina]
MTEPASSGGRPPTDAERSTTTRLRQGVTLGHMRWVLAISLALAVVPLVVLGMRFGGS